MTIILIGMNADYALQVSDRRLSWNGVMRQEEHSKSFSLMMPGFRFTVAFTGLAQIDRFATMDWLLDRLTEIGRTAWSPDVVLDRLATSLSHRFTTFIDIKMLPRAHRSLVLTIVGYNHSEHPPRGLAAEISNTHDAEGRFRVRFTSERRPTSEPWTWLGAFGNGAALDRVAMEGVRAKLKHGINASAVQGMLFKQIRRMSDDPRSGDTIGKQLDYILVYSDPNKAVTGGRSSTVVKAEMIVPPSVVIAGEGQAIAVKGLTIAPATASQPPLTIPVVHRNHPCPCGSGLRYRLCHGRLPG